MILFISILPFNVYGKELRERLFQVLIPQLLEQYLKKQIFATVSMYDCRFKVEGSNYYRLYKYLKACMRLWTNKGQVLMQCYAEDSEKLPNEMIILISIIACIIA